MSTVLQLCRELFKTDDLYKVLGVQKEASDKELKKGYHKVSLKVHPDRVGPAKKDEATKKFQLLGKVYSILSDKDKRAVYDETGEIDDEDDVVQDRDWYDYWRLLFKKISVADIKKFEKEYKGSQEELDDLKATYVEFEGCLDDILENVMCATEDDEDRFTKIINGWIKAKEVPDYDGFSKETKASKTARKRRFEAEAKEAEEAAEQLGLNSKDGDSSLHALIQKRQKSREAQADDFFAQMEAKYATKEKSKAKSGAKGVSKKKSKS